MNFNKRINLDDSLMDLTPIVDVVFNLLIFFALSLNFSQVVSSINIKLPKAQSSEIVTEKQVVVSIEKNNKVSINDQFLYIDQIPNYLDKISKENVVVVKADKSIDHGFVVQIMDLIKRSGFKKLGIAVSKED
jgi:biopolymer transport protein ExbD